MDCCDSVITARTMIADKLSATVHVEETVRVKATNQQHERLWTNTYLAG